eukprot:2504714-Rhodomonas_salina.2
MKYAHAHAHAHAARTRTHAHARTHSVSLSLSFSLSLRHKHTKARSLARSLAQTHTHTPLARSGFTTSGQTRQRPPENTAATQQVRQSVHQPGMGVHAWMRRESEPEERIEPTTIAQSSGSEPRPGAIDPTPESSARPLRELLRSLFVEASGS